MNFEESISISATPTNVFSVYTQVSEWPKWDLETEASALDGEFKVGSEGKIKPKGAPVSKIKLTEVTENESFTVECNLPFCKMHFVHLLQADGDNTKVINRLNFSGFLAPLFSRLLGKSISKTIPQSLAGLKRYIEATG